MNFISYQYAFFLGAVFLLYWRLGRKAQHWLLLIASYGFYACWDWRFLGLIFLTSCIDFVSGRQIHSALKTHSSRHKAKLWLAFTLVTNLSILAYFKYANFFIESFINLLSSLGIETHTGTLSIILPVGISFYTFQSISYSIDIYRKELEPEKDLIDFLTFVAFFPQLVAGPIVRAQEFLYQMSERRKFNWDDIQEGIHRIFTGIIKKAIIADTLAMQLVDPVFNNPEEYSSQMLWVAALAYAVQIYCDFSGYSNIAIGSARLFGFKLPENFNYPYLSRNFSEFWLRWHMTMSRFFRDYVYIPLGGNRRSKPRNLLNLGSTTLVSGLWHGAAWHFVIWGGLHGVLLVIQRLIPATIRKITPWFITYLIVQFFVLITWIFFRATDTYQAAHFIQGMFANQPGEFLPITPVTWLCFGMFIVDHIYGAYPQRFNAVLAKPLAKACFWVLTIAIAHNAMPQGANPFIYFQF